MQLYIQALRKYADFSGRASRAEFWTFTGMNVIVSILVPLLIALAGGNETLIQVGANLYGFAVMVPSLAVGVRRMHDVDKSGWIIWIPLYNLILALQNGTAGENRFGPIPTDK